MPKSGNAAAEVVPAEWRINSVQYIENNWFGGGGGGSGSGSRS